MNDQQIYDWAKKYEEENPSPISITQLLSDFQDELLYLMIKKLGDKQ